MDLPSRLSSAVKMPPPPVGLGDVTVWRYAPDGTLRETVTLTAADFRTQYGPVLWDTEDYAAQQRARMARARAHKMAVA